MENGKYLSETVIALPQPDNGRRKTVSGITVMCEPLI
jgi:hypothetical protein